MHQYGKVVDIYNWGITGITHLKLDVNRAEIDMP